MNFTIYFGNHEDKEVYTMDCYVEIEEETVS
ncbi:hypothetical protein CN925_13080 [Bacillus sp. AFS055030]|nr:hypothetical protein CN925_13080 [Bacillus sp. AFS055030]